MKHTKRITALLAIFLFSFIINCDNEPLLTNIGTNQLLVVLKGTYESNSPMPWSMPQACQSSSPRDSGVIACDTYTADHLAYVQDDSVVDCDGTDTGPYGKDDTNPNVFLIDISEMKLQEYGRESQKFANYRQTLAFNLSDDNPFFNGAGFILDNDDAPSKVYAGVLLYVRKMLLDGAKKYTPGSDGWRSEPVWDVFSEQELPTFNFNKYQMHSFYDSLRLESAYMNRVYPLIVPISDLRGMVFSNAFPVTVLEIRFVVKNFIKKYELTGISGDMENVTHYYALSDWLQDVQEDDRVIGGNLLTVARSYIPGLVGSIPGYIGNSSDLAPGRHVIAVPAGANINDYTIPNVSGSLRTDNPCNLPNSPSLALTTNLMDMMDYYLNLEKYSYKWNEKVPISCPTFDEYKNEWDDFASDVGFKVPELAVFAQVDAAPVGPYTSTASFAIENVPPGTYDIYVAQVPPTYGKLYYDSQFVEYPNNPVTVSVGSCRDSLDNDTIVFDNP